MSYAIILKSKDISYKDTYLIGGSKKQPLEWKLSKCSIRAKKFKNRETAQEWLDQVKEVDLFTDRLEWHIVEIIYDETYHA